MKRPRERIRPRTLPNCLRDSEKTRTGNRPLRAPTGMIDMRVQGRQRPPVPKRMKGRIEEGLAAPAQLALLFSLLWCAGRIGPRLGDGFGPRTSWSETNNISGLLSELGGRAGCSRESTFSLGPLPIPNVAREFRAYKVNVPEHGRVCRGTHRHRARPARRPRASGAAVVN